MNLQQAQLGTGRDLSLGGYVPAPAPRTGLLQQALAAIVSGAGGALASNVVNSALTPDAGKVAVANQVMAPGMTQQADGRIVDQRNGVQKFFMPLKDSDVSAAQSALAQSKLAGAQTNRINVMTPAELAAITASTDKTIKDAPFQRNLMGAQTNLANTQGLSLNAMIEPNRQKAQAETRQLDAGTTNLGAKTATEDALRPGQIAQQGATLKYTGAETASKEAGTKNQNIMNYTLGEPQRNAALGRFMQENGIAGPNQQAVVQELTNRGYDPINDPTGAAAMTKPAIDAGIAAQAAKLGSNKVPTGFNAMTPQQQAAMISKYGASAEQVAAIQALDAQKAQAQAQQDADSAGQMFLAKRKLSNGVSGILDSIGNAVTW